ncbi:hypothetical protein GCK32_009651 [Trichostrongylus colubriformis]|uniref:ShKT domain-containing protein n=1 Tax=Trichostrongylus colubriformis TaxID=6319 RepID=A0AAN8J2H5_TRICO
MLLYPLLGLALLFNLNEAEMCVDQWRTCGILQENGWCESDDRKNFILMTKNCKETCGFCRGIPLEAPPETEQELKMCQDRKSNCDIRQKMGWCNDESKSNFMKKYCKETCLFCAGMPK